MRFFATVFRRLRRMPPVLAVATGWGMVLGAVLVLVTVIPVPSWKDAEGRPVSYGELWRSGTGVTFLLIGGGLIVFAVACYRAQNWIRYAIPAAMGAGTIYFVLFPDSDAPYGWLGTLAWTLISLWYFHGKRDVAAYFRGDFSVRAKG